MRKFKIWYYGRLPLAKKIRKRIIIDLIYEHIKGWPHPTTIAPKEFEKAINASQIEWLNTIQK